HLRVGAADTRTRIALGPLGRPLFGSRVLKRGDFGLDVSVLQFLLTRRGVYNGALDGYFGAETAASLKRYQRLIHVSADSVVGPPTSSAIACRDRVPVRADVPKPVTSIVHVVHVGDTLTALAKGAGTTIAAIASLNHIDASKPILIGQRLRIPSSTA